MGMINDNLFDQLLQEESEFSGKDTPASNNPTKGWDPSLSKETNISVPGGTSERPTAKPYDGEYGPTPSGLSERPNSGWPEVSIPIPSSEVLQDPTYNKALSALQKSFEAAAFSIKVMNERSNQLTGGDTAASQDAYTESVIGEAMVTALDDGPYFESLQREDKDQVKALVKSMRGKLQKLNLAGIKFYKPAKWLRMFFIGGSEVGNASANDSPDIRGWFNTRMWSIVGAVLIEKGSANEFVKELNSQFSDELGEYKFLMVKMPPTISDVFRLKFGWKNTKQSYFILIDKKITSEIKQAIAALKAIEKKDDKVVEESTKCKGDDCDDDDCKDGKCKKEKDDKDDDEDDDNDAKTESVIDDFFDEGVKDALGKAGKAVKDAGTQALGTAVVGGHMLNIMRKACGSIIKSKMESTKKAAKKYKDAKAKKDFNAMRSAKDELREKGDEMIQASAKELNKAVTSEKIGAKDVDEAAKNLAEMIISLTNEDKELAEFYKATGHDLTDKDALVRQIKKAYKDHGWA